MSLDITQTALPERKRILVVEDLEALGQLANNMPVAVVAERVGYRNASAFTAMFRRTLGMEPRRYFSGELTAKAE